jgi:hypothetical protein
LVIEILHILRLFEVEMGSCLSLRGFCSAKIYPLYFL